MMSVRTAYFYAHGKRLELRLKSGAVVEGMISEYARVEEPWLSLNGAICIRLSDIEEWRVVGPWENEKKAELDRNTLEAMGKKWYKS